jgi:hypothetical protein
MARMMLLLAGIFSLPTSLLAQQPAAMQSYTDGTITLPYPQGWKILDASQRQALMKDLAPIIDKVADGKKTNTNISVMIHEGKDLESSLANVNITKSQERIPVPLNQRGKDELTKILQKMGAAMGGVTQMRSISDEQINDRKVLVSKYDVLLGGDSLTQNIYAFPSKDGTYNLTFSAPSKEFPKYEPIFREMVTKFQSPPPPAFDISKLPIGLIVGATVGAIIGMMKVFGGSSSSKKKPKREDGDSFASYSGS